MLVPSKPSWNFCVQLQDSISLFKHHFHINAASWLSAEHLIQWQQPSSQIFPDSLWTILSKAYPQKNGTLLHGILQATGFQSPTTFPEEVWIIGRQPLFIITCHCPCPFAPQAYLTIQPSSSYPTSSGMAHGPILLLGSFISTLINMSFDRREIPTSLLPYFVHLNKSNVVRIFGKKEGCYTIDIEIHTLIPSTLMPN